MLLLFRLQVPSSLASANIAPAEVCEFGKPSCVILVIQEMERRYNLKAQQCDRDAVFALNYLRTTEVFQQTLDEIGYDDPAAVIREDALFAEYYFRADDAYHTDNSTVA